MDVKAYIESGILQDYCLGILSENENKQIEAYAKTYPEIKNEIDAFHKALEQYALEFNSDTSLSLKTKTLNIIENLINEEKRLRDDLPILNKYSDHNKWLRIAKPLLPENLNEQIYFKVLRNDDTLFQTIIWTKLDYPEEVHDDLKECFIILEGECECYLGNEIIRLGPGGFLDIPLHVHHDIKVIKGPVLAVVQRLKVA